MSANEIKDSEEAMSLRDIILDNQYLNQQNQDYISQLAIEKLIELFAGLNNDRVKMYIIRFMHNLQKVYTTAKLKIRKLIDCCDGTK